MTRKKETGLRQVEEASAAAESAQAAAEAQERQKAPNAVALVPIVVFLVLYLGVGVYFEYVNPVEGQMGFYIMSVVVAFLVALSVALVQNRSLTFDQKMRVCARGVGDENIVIMVFIFLFAGVFSGLASAAGGAASTANMMLSVIPETFAIPGLFLIAAIISLAMGTSVGTISVLVPIAAAVAANAGLDLAFSVGAVVGGAMFGDNLSFISDTTIAATKTQGVAMKDKFYENVKIALPTALVTLVVLVVLTASSTPSPIDSYDYDVLQAIPYFVVLFVAMAGVNVFLVLGLGIVLFVVAGAVTGSLDFTTVLTAMGTGANGMFETIIVTLLVASIGALMREHGGFAAILAFVRKRFHGVRGGMTGIALLTLLLDIAAANNTVAIVMAGPIAKQIGSEYGVEPRQTASIMDTCSCIGQGIIPYGAQLLVAAGLAGISSVAIIPYLHYQFLLAIAVVIYIATCGLRAKRA